MESFAFEDLIVWQRSMDWVSVVLNIEYLFPRGRNFKLIRQLEAALASVPMNIAEGKGRNSKKEFRQFLYYSRGSLYETITILEIYLNQGWISENDFHRVRNEGIEIVKMLKGLINALN